MTDEGKLLTGMVKAIDREIERLEKLKKGKDKLLPRARLVIYSCIVIAEGDGKFLYKEENKMVNEIFKRYGITKEVAEKYRPSEFGIITLANITEEILKTSFEPDFLNDLHKQLCKISTVDKELATGELNILKKLYDLFGLTEFEKNS